MMLLLYIALPLGTYSLVSVIWFSLHLSHTIPQWVRKQGKAFPSTLLTPIHVSQLLFHQVPSDDRFLCMYAHFVGGEPCSGRPNKKDGKFASRLREALATYRPDKSSTEQLLGEYARRCLCTKHWKSMSGMQSFYDFWNQQTHQWLQDLRALYNDGVEIALRTCDISDSERTDDLMLKPIASGGDRSRQSTPQPTGAWPASQTDSIVEDGRTSRDQDLRTSIFQRYQNHFNIPPNRHRDDTLLKSDFTEYPPGATTLCEVITRELNVEESKKGWVYAYSFDHETNASYHKIGYSQDTDGRLQQWQASCGTRYKQKVSIETPNAKRVEQLVHTELQLLNKRRYNHSCFNNVGGRCAVVHNEWFEVDEGDAERIIEYWVEWMKENTPYDDEGRLRTDAILLMYPGDRRSGNTAGEDVQASESTYRSFLYDSSGAIWHPIDRRGSRSDSSPRPQKHNRKSSSTIRTKDKRPSLPQCEQLKSIGVASNSHARRGRKEQSPAFSERKATPTKASSNRVRRGPIDDYLVRGGGDEDDDALTPLSGRESKEKQLSNPSELSRVPKQDGQFVDIGKLAKTLTKPSSSRTKNDRAASTPIAPSRGHGRSRVSSAPNVLLTSREQTGTSDDPIEIDS